MEDFRIKVIKILIVNNQKIPVKTYGGTQRVIWWLGKELLRLNHKVTYLVGKGSKCPFADVLTYNSDAELDRQIPVDIDVVHVHFPIGRPLRKPYIVTVHGNPEAFKELDRNTVFLSNSHAQRYNSEVFVYNGIDVDDYGQVSFNLERKHLLFLGRASRGVKNLKDCKYIAQKVGEKLVIVGGHGFSFSSKISYKGFLGGTKKNRLINQSKALLYPIKGFEPFGLAIIESLYFGCPVVGTKYGSLPELVTPEVGFLSNSRSELVEALRNLDIFDRKKCHEYVCNNFTSKIMTRRYLKLYEIVMNGHHMNKEEPYRTIKLQSKFLPIYD